MPVKDQQVSMAGQRPRRGRIAPYLPQAHRQNRIVIDVVAHAAFGYAAGGYQVICDGIVGPWFIDLGPYEAQVVDSTRLTPQATADAVQRGPADGTFRLTVLPLAP